MENAIVGTIAGFIFEWFFIRGLITGLVKYKLNRSAFNKRKKDQTIKEWFLYLRFRDLIPKSWIVLYFWYLLSNPITLVIYVILSLLGLATIGASILKTILMINFVSSLGIGMALWKCGHGDYYYERYFQKEKRNKK